MIYMYHYREIFFWNNTVLREIWFLEIKWKLNHKKSFWYFLVDQGMNQKKKGQSFQECAISIGAVLHPFWLKPPSNKNITWIS